MNILFDGCVPRALRKFLAGHQVQTAQQLDWGELQNGDLIRAAEEKFDALVTADKNIRYQQNVTGRKIAILVLPTNRWPVLQTMTGRIADVVNGLKAGDFVQIELD